MSTTSKAINDLSPDERRALLTHLLQEKASQPKSFPLSFAQERLWFLDQFQPGNPVYNIPAAMRMTVPLHIPALERSLNEIVRRHEVLRTTFTVVAGQPLQVVAPRLTLPLPLHDLQHLPLAAHETEAQRRATEEARLPFDLARGPLLRMSLLRLGPRDHVLLLTMHHIISDGWSLTIFFRELGMLYEAYAAGRPSPLPELPIQYADFAHWQRAWLQGSGARGQGSGRQGDKETGRQGDKEQGASAPSQPAPCATLVPHPPSPIEAQLAYWRQQLTGAPAVLELPIDRPRPPMQTFNGAHYAFDLPGALAAGLAALCQREDVTPFMALLAAFQTLLYRYTGQTDVVVGAPIAGRTRVETEGLIGFFINTLVLRTSLAGNPAFCELLGRVREVTLGAYAHQDLPFEKLVEELQPERSLSHTPLFQVVFTLQNTPTFSPAAAGARPAAQAPAPQVSTGTAKFDLNLSMMETAQGLMGSFEYNTDLFDAATIERMRDHFQTLLGTLIADPDQPVGTLPILTAAERQQIAAWNATTVEDTFDRCIHQVFEDQAARAPDAVALVFDRLSTTDHRPPTTDPPSPLHPFTPSPLHPFICQRLTYNELNRRANQLAHHLRALGVGPERAVGILAERSVEMVVALLGTMKAGAAYVPLNPANPPERLAFMLEDAHVDVLLTTNDQRPTTNDRPSLHPFTPSPLHPFTLSHRSVVYLDTNTPAIAASSDENPVTITTPDSRTVIIYTSGSTGRPKGIALNGRGYLNLFRWYQSVCQLDERTRFLLMLSFSFDSALKDIIAPLFAGGQVILGPAGHLDPAILLEIIEACRVTATSCTPSLLYPLLDLARRRGYAPLASMDCLCIGGEPTIVSRLRGWFKSPHNRCRLVHVYGQTETTDISLSYGPLAGRDLVALERLPIGKLLPNIQLAILNPHGQLQPIGVAGEVCIAGIGLAHGYLNRPDLTAERFIPNPFAGVTGDGCWVLEDSAPVTQHPSPNTRLYKTGDLARYLPDGMIEYLGRIDAQVKIRGFRIELGEIETVLSQHPAVRKSVVVAREDVPGDKRLVAYVVPTNDQRPTTNEEHDERGQSSFVVRRSSFVDTLRAFLQTKLPDYMVPSAFVTLEALPLTPSGKLDVQALPAPDWVQLGGEREFVAPRTPTEELVAGIWAEVLGVERVGVHDNFFALGGHSLRATQVVARVLDALQVELPLRRLFEAPTVAGLAQAIAQAQGQPVAGAISRLDRGNEEQLLAELAGYSDDEVTALFGDLLAEKEPLSE